MNRLHLLIFLSLVQYSIAQQWVTNPINNHQYKLVLTNTNWSQANASAELNPGEYLATITYQSEYDFIMSNIMGTNTQIWIGATAVGSPDGSLYTWVSGPESGVPLYDKHISKCFGYCKFVALEPDTLLGQKYIHIWNTNGLDDATDSTTFFDNTPMNGYIIEKGGSTDPVIWPKDSEPGILTISNLDKRPFNTSKLRVNFQGSSISRPDFECTIITFNKSSVTCQTTQYLVGEYTLNITDGVQVHTLLRYHSNLPLITSLFIKYQANETITVNGRNFGDDLSQINQFMISSNIPCTPISMPILDRSFKCLLTQTIYPDYQTLTPPTRVTSVSSLTVGNIKLENIVRIPMYNNDTDSLLMFTSDSADTYSNNYYRTESFVCQHFTPQTRSDICFTRNMLNWDWTLFFANNIGGNFILTSGPDAGKTIVYANKTINPLVIDTTVVSLDSTFDTTQKFLGQSVVDLKLYTSMNPSWKTYTKFTINKPPPVFTKSVNKLLPTDGGWIELPVDNMRFTSSNYTLTRMNLVVISSRIIPFHENGTLGVLFPPGTGVLGPLTLYVDNKNSSGSSFTYNLGFYPPIINDITNINANGSVATIIGTQFGINSSIIDVLHEGKVLKAMNIVTAHKVLSFNLPRGSGTSKIQIRVDGQLSNILAFDYKDCGDFNFCSGNGRCVNGYCECTTGFGNCSSTTNGSTPIIPNTNQSNSTAGPFSFLFRYVREVDATGIPVVTYPVSDIVWGNTTVDPSSSSNTTAGTIPSVIGFKITVISRYFATRTNITFGQQQFIMDANTTKYQSTLSAWPFKSKTNSLELVYQIEAPSQNDRCQQTSIDYSKDTNYLKYINVVLGDQVFVSKFINLAVIDGRPTLTSNRLLLKSSDLMYLEPMTNDTSINSRLYVSMVSPYFDKQAVLDPNFSVLTNIGGHGADDLCDRPKRVWWWWIPILVGGVVVLTAVAIGVFIGVRRNWLFKREDKNLSVKMNKL
ncbi:hypothetical protein SAMD00019534_033080 [Acytostelium subglobosum LB1]|uniref:hypothetical protein n=1 Tax=Acytostelium subglobosum LB1 TaxID=1410327 RepID=UPI000644A26C|nr:hypothetical protein SAMD00019534_033080 [Acytostelium subglobosum LB1]GAM20133.1 hypothetical protein SAMD00019534_033080 [Acytostelium subglobosum LB1]|eukprot:XP_012756895.1 hypothetical protein SAMD00019534_033080 [Acytostelium subglobosum LB1]